MYNTLEIMDIGIACLVEKLGVVNAEHFIATIKRENFDYTVWQREYFDKMNEGEFLKEAADYAKNHHHKGKGKEV